MRYAQLGGGDSLELTTARRAGGSRFGVLGEQEGNVAGVQAESEEVTNTQVFILLGVINQLERGVSDRAGSCP